MPPPTTKTPSLSGARRTLLRNVLVLGLVTAVVAIATWPVTTRSGVNYVWSSQQIPLYEKFVDFLSRDLQLRRMAHEVTAGAVNRQDKLLRIFTWVTTHIRPAPPDVPIMDDHVLHVMIRGYGADDQIAEVFAVLAGYAGFHVRVARLEPPGHRNVFLMVALVEDSADTYVFDPRNHVVFRDEHGRFVDVNQLIRNPELIAASASGRIVRGVPYEQYFLGVQDAKVFSRVEAQKFWPRLKQELEQALNPHHGSG